MACSVRSGVYEDKPHRVQRDKTNRQHQQGVEDLENSNSPQSFTLVHSTVSFASENPVAGQTFRTSDSPARAIPAQRSSAQTEPPWRRNAVRRQAPCYRYTGRALRHSHVHVVLQHEDLLEVAAEHAADGQDEQDGDRRANALKGDMPHPLPAVRPIQLCRLIQGRIDAGDGRDVDNRIPSGLFQRIGEIGYPPKILRLTDIQNLSILQPQAHHDLVDHTAFAEPVQRDPAEDRPGDKVRQIRDRLHGALKPDAPDLVQQQANKIGIGKPSTSLIVLIPKVLRIRTPEAFIR